jgi:hypothetical protein
MRHVCVQTLVNKCLLTTRMSLLVLVALTSFAYSQQVSKLFIFT